MRSLAVTVALIGTTLVPLPLNAQRRDCAEMKSPKQLPPVGVVLDSARAIADLQASNVLASEQLFSLVFREGDSVPKIRPLEGTDVQAAVVFSHSVWPQQLLGTWAVRVRVTDKGTPALTLERSIYCPPVPAGRSRLPDRYMIEVQAGDRMPSGRRIRTVLEVQVGENGDALVVRLERSTGLKELDAEMTNRWQQRRFLPALLDDMPITAWYRSDGRSPRL